jgi:hypothetical protein
MNIGTSPSVSTISRSAPARLTGPPPAGKTAPVKVEPVRENVLRLTATRQELAVLVAAARMALDAMSDDPSAPREAVELLGRVVADYDAAAGAGAGGSPA